MPVPTRPRLNGLLRRESDPGFGLIEQPLTTLQNSSF